MWMEGQIIKREKDGRLGIYLGIGVIEEDLGSKNLFFAYVFTIEGGIKKIDSLWKETVILDTDNALKFVCASTFSEDLSKEKIILEKASKLPLLIEYIWNKGMDIRFIDDSLEEIK